MKRRFPNVRSGTLAGDVGVTVAKFLNGINYQAIKDEFEKDFGQIDAVIGKVGWLFSWTINKFKSIFLDYFKVKNLLNPKWISA